eukprot:11690635-Alexandrium_andersonii.AAC.1
MPLETSGRLSRGGSRARSASTSPCTAGRRSGGAACGPRPPVRPPPDAWVCRSPKTLRQDQGGCRRPPPGGHRPA